MESVALNPLVVKTRWQRKPRLCFRKVCVKGGIKAADLRYVRKGHLARPHALQVKGLMQGRKAIERGEGRQHGACELGGMLVSPPPMDDAMDYEGQVLRTHRGFGKSVREVLER